MKTSPFVVALGVFWGLIAFKLVSCWWDYYLLSCAVASLGVRGCGSYFDQTFLGLEFPQFAFACIAISGLLVFLSSLSSKKNG